MAEIIYRYVRADFTNNISDESAWKKIYNAPDKAIWQIRTELKKALIEYVKETRRNELNNYHENPKKIFEQISLLNERALIVGSQKELLPIKGRSFCFTILIN